jgi:hypothetical protein
MCENSRKLARRVTDELAMQVAPVGEAWWAYLQSTPEKEVNRDLYKEDGVHATPMGTYLTACVFCAALLGKSPEGLPGADFPNAADLQRVAWEATKDG